MRSDVGFFCNSMICIKTQRFVEHSLWMVEALNELFPVESTPHTAWKIYVQLQITNLTWGEERSSPISSHAGNRSKGRMLRTEPTLENACSTLNLNWRTLAPH
jgi:hypothetical protein